MQTPQHQSEVAIAAFYAFFPLADPSALAGLVREEATRQDVYGTILLAKEGVNGTIAGEAQAVRHLLAFLGDQSGCGPLDVKWASAPHSPFRRMKVAVRREIVSLGVAGIDPARQTGIYVDPKDWNALIADPATIAIDTRNAYEVDLGTFKGAMDPKTECFRSFPGWLKANHETLRNRPLAMFCTGGIRCEKATALALAEGLGPVYHLKGGILSYLEHVPPAESQWTGECFVFDHRVTVDHALQPGTFSVCKACRRPLTDADRRSPYFIDGVSCAACHATKTPAQKARYAERHKQMSLAEIRAAREA